MKRKTEPVTPATHRLFIALALFHCLTLVVFAWIFWGPWGSYDHGLLGEVGMGRRTAKAVVIIVITGLLGVRGLWHWLAVMLSARRTGSYVWSADDDEVELLREVGITPVSVALRSTGRMLVVLAVLGVAALLV